jgi:hypothetical protein
MMKDPLTPRAQSLEQRKRNVWSAPKLTRLEAGKAETGQTRFTDGSFLVS